MGAYVIVIFWIIISVLVMFEYVDAIQSAGENKLIVCLIFFIGGPIFAASDLLQRILDIFLPEGWNSND